MTIETPAPYDGCFRECSEGHTYIWGRCEQGIQLPPTLFAARTAIAGDGELSAGFDGFPLALLLPWTVHLPVAEQHEMLEELADALPEDRNAIFAGWYATAASLSDPTRRDILLGKFDPADFVKADRPFATGGIVGAGALPILEAGCTYPMPSRADIEADRAVTIKMRSPEDAKADTEPGGSFWADLRRRLRDEPEFRTGYIETSRQIQAADDAANGDGPFRDGLRDQLVATGMAAAEQWLAARANRRMSDVNKKQLVGHIINALWGQIEQAAIGMAEHLAEGRESEAADAADSPWCPDCVHGPSAHRRTTGCIRCTCNYGRGNEEQAAGRDGN